MSTCIYLDYTHTHRNTKTFLGPDNMHNIVSYLFIVLSNNTEMCEEDSVHSVSTCSTNISKWIHVGFPSFTSDWHWRLEHGGGSGCHGSHRGSGCPQLHPGLRTLHRQEVTSQWPWELWDCGIAVTHPALPSYMLLSRCLLRRIAPCRRTAPPRRLDLNATDISECRREKQ